MSQRHRMSGSLIELASEVRETWFGPFKFAEFRNLATHRSSFAISRGDLRGEAPLLVRAHSSCVTSEFFGACDCDCAAQLDGALAEIANEGRGVVFYLPQEGRGAGLVAKARDRMIVQASRQRITTFEAYERMGLKPDLRRYDEVAAMSRLLEIRAPFILLTNNPDKVEALEREKLQIVQMQPLERAAQPFNAHYLSSKRRSGHRLAHTPSAAAELPESVVEIEPENLAGRHEIVRIAEYLLPMARTDAGRNVEGRADSLTPRPIWMRLHLYIDVERGGEIVVLSCDRDPDAAPLVRIHPMPLLDRFPLRGARARQSWESMLRVIDQHGRGVVVFAPRDVRGVPMASEGAGVLDDLLRDQIGNSECIGLVDPDVDRDAPITTDLEFSEKRRLQDLLAGLER